MPDQPSPPERGASEGAPGIREPLSLRRIVDEAVRLADADGIEGVTIRTLSARLGFTTMAVYRHVSSSAELTERMADQALGSPPSESHGPWRSALDAWTRGLHRRYLEHPWLLDLPLPGAPRTPNHAAWVELLLSATQGLDLPLDRRLEAGLLLDAHARNLANLERGIRGASAGSRDGVPPPVQVAGASGRYPLLERAMQAGILTDPTAPDLRFGITVVLDGLDAAARHHASDRDR
jgi:AcrR family transcriptional regulator